MENATQIAVRKLNFLSAGVRCDAVKLLASLESPTEEVVSALGAALQDEKDYVRERVAKALYCIGAHHPQIAVAALLEALRTESSYVRADIVDALGAVAEKSQEEFPELAPKLQELLEDDVFEVRKSAAYALYLIQ
jgi:HEAT repeat protein